MRRRDAILAGLALPLAGCSRGAHVEVSGEPLAPTFTIREAGLFKGDVVFPGGLRVSDRTDSPAETVWVVTSDLAPPTDAVVVYGRTPPGARELTPARPLREGRLYEVLVYGGGYHGGAVFKIVDGRLITGEAAADAPEREIRARAT